jgi:hypothetical protein
MYIYFDFIITISTPMKSYFINDPTNLGAKLEADVYNQIKEMKEFDVILLEKDLVSMFGWNSSSIDQLLIIDNYMIPIQLKWRRTRRRETQGIENFIRSIQYIKNRINKDVLFGVWSSRMMPFEDNVLLLETEKIVSVSFFDDIDGLVLKTIKVIQEQLNRSL